MTTTPAPELAAAIAFLDSLYLTDPDGNLTNRKWPEAQAHAATLRALSAPLPAGSGDEWPIDPDWLHAVLRFADKNPDYFPDCADGMVTLDGNDAAAIISALNATHPQAAPPEGETMEVGSGMQTAPIVPWTDAQCIEFMAVGLRHVEYAKRNPGPTIAEIRQGQIRAAAISTQEPTPMTGPVEAITFDELVEFGRNNGGNIVNGMPWSFKYKGVHVTHENDNCYTICRGLEDLKLHRGGTLTTYADGTMTTTPAPVAADDPRMASMIEHGMSGINWTPSAPVAVELEAFAMLVAFAKAAHEAMGDGETFADHRVMLEAPGASDLTNALDAMDALPDVPGPLVYDGWARAEYFARRPAPQAAPQAAAQVTDGETIVIDGRRYALDTVRTALLGLAKDFAALRPGGQAVGCLNVQRFRGSDAMVNTSFDYYGSLPDGSYTLYITPELAGSADVLAPFEAFAQRLATDRTYDGDIVEDLRDLIHETRLNATAQGEGEGVMGGLARIAKALGGIVINGEKYVWDYFNNVCIPAGEMPAGSDRWKASEQAKYRITSNKQLEPFRD